VLKKISTDGREWCSFIPFPPRKDQTVHRFSSARQDPYRGGGE
jgi:hypothetical protein